MKEEKKPSREALATRYGSRAIKRMIGLLLWAFVLFLVAVGIIWTIPRVWQFAFG
jgi:hypothetical protein